MKRLRNARQLKNSDFQSVWEELALKRSDLIITVIFRNYERRWKTREKKKRGTDIYSIPLAMLVLVISIVREFLVNQVLLPMLVHSSRLRIGYLLQPLMISLNTATSGYSLYST